MKHVKLYCFIAGLLFISVTKIFFLDYYKIPTGSMLPAIVPNHCVIINKLVHTLHAHNLTKNLLQYNVNKGEIYVFNVPRWNNRERLNTDTGALGEPYVKRCVGLPGDTVVINKPSISSFSEEPDMSNKKFGYPIFPHDSTINWTINKFGPLWIPRKNSTVTLNSYNFKLYKSLLNYEGTVVSVLNNSFFINGKKVTTYKFKCNYYFMLGDNFYDSADSRFWGLVPEKNLIGKVIFIL